METILWVVLGIVLIIFMTMLLVFKFGKGKKYRPNYYAMFLLGLVWLPAGILFYFSDSGSSVGDIFFILGLIYFIIGLSHRKEWKKNGGFKKLKKKKRKQKILLFVILGAVLVAGLILFFILRDNTEEVVCAADVKICPDGTYVSRVPPDCEFEACPVSKVCEDDDCCVVFGAEGDCNCGCFNKDALPQEEIGGCFCAVPVSCECIDGECVEIF